MICVHVFTKKYIEPHFYSKSKAKQKIETKNIKQLSTFNFIVLKQSKTKIALKR